MWMSGVVMLLFEVLMSLPRTVMPLLLPHGVMSFFGVSVFHET